MSDPPVAGAPLNDPPPETEAAAASGPVGVSPERRGGWPAALAFAAAMGLLYLFVASRTTLFDRDEPRFAEAAVEMVRTGNLLYPTFNGELRPDKPILIYWLMAASIRALGTTELAVRLPSALGAVGAALLVYEMGRRLWNSRVGLTAMGVMATTPLLLMMGTAATADGVLLFFLTAAMAVLARGLGAGFSWRHTPPLAAAIGGAVLTKGPVGLAVPLLGLAGASLLLRRHRPVPLRAWTIVAVASFAGLALFFLWAVPANRATHGEFAAQGLGHHVVGRALRPLEGHGGRWFLTLPYYFPILVGLFFPWTLHLIGALSAVAGGRVGGPVGRALLLGWAVPTFLLMSLVATKLPHYILPIWPALSLAVAGALDAERRGGLTSRDRALLHRGGVLFAPVALGAAATLVIGPWAAGLPELRAPGLAVGSLLGVWSAVALRQHLRRRFAAGAATLAIGMPATLALAAAVALPAVEALKPVPPLARAIRERTPADTPVAAYGSPEPSLVFYTRRAPVASVGRGGLAAWAVETRPGVLVIPAPDWARWAAHAPAASLTALAQARGVNAANGGRLELRAVLRRGAEPRQPVPFDGPAVQQEGDEPP